MSFGLNAFRLLSALGLAAALADAASATGVRGVDVGKERDLFEDDFKLIGTLVVRKKIKKAIAKCTAKTNEIATTSIGMPYFIRLQHRTYPDGKQVNDLIVDNPKCHQEQCKTSIVGDSGINYTISSCSDLKPKAGIITTGTYHQGTGGGGPGGAGAQAPPPGICTNETLPLPPAGQTLNLTYLGETDGPWYEVCNTPLTCCHPEGEDIDQECPSGDGNITCPGTCRSYGGENGECPVGEEYYACAWPKADGDIVLETGNFTCEEGISCTKTAWPTNEAGPCPNGMVCLNECGPVA